MTTLRVRTVQVRHLMVGWNLLWNEEEMPITAVWPCPNGSFHVVCDYPRGFERNLPALLEVRVR